jgi:hypothetical protein
MVTPYKNVYYFNMSLDFSFLNILNKGNIDLPISLHLFQQIYERV